MTTLPQRVVFVNVLKHTESKGKINIELDIPEWQSKFPIVLYGADETAISMLAVGDAKWVELKATKLKGDKDGTAPWDYFWDYFWDAPKPADKEAPAPASAPRDFGAEAVKRDQNIQKAVALKAAVDWECGHPQSPNKHNVDTTLELANRFLTWLEEV